MSTAWQPATLDRWMSSGVEDEHTPSLRKDDESTPDKELNSNVNSESAVAEPLLVAVMAAWSAVEAQWEDEGRHAAFIELCRAAGRLDLAAKQYRAVADAGHPFADRARRQLDRVLSAALANMELNRTEPETGAPRWLTLLAAAVSGLLIYWVLSAWLR